MVIAQTDLLSDTTSVDSTEDRTYFDEPVFTEYTTGDGRLNFTPIDTGLDFIQRYNTAKAPWFPMAYLGNIGAPAQARWFRFDLQPGLNTGRSQFDHYLLGEDSVRFYRTNAPFTEIYYVLGNFTEQQFHITHTQNFGKDLNLAVHFERIVSQGHYQRHRNTGSNFFLSGWWRSPGEKYRLFAKLHHNDMVNEESGGLRPDTLFTTYESPVSLAEPWLDNAITDWKIWTAGIGQTYDIGKFGERTGENDSVYRIFEPRVRISQDLKWFNNRYNFIDASSDRTYFSLPDATTDTLKAIHDIDGWKASLNVFNVQRNDSARLLAWDWMLGAEYISTQLSDAAGRVERDYMITKASTSFQLNTALPFVVHGNLTSDLIQEDVLAKAGTVAGDSIWQLYATLTSGSIQPTWLQQRFTYFAGGWDQALTLENINLNRIEAGFISPASNTTLSAQFSQIGNYAYFTGTSGIADFRPVQDGAAEVLQLKLEKGLEWKQFRFRQAIGWQRIFSGNINVPEFLADLSWYYEHKLFEDALGLQAGFDAWWVSNYAADGYDPISGVFFYQSLEELSFYPVVDLFINFDIRTFRFFVKADNISQGLFRAGYFEAPGYPMQFRSIKAGIQWHVLY